MDFYGDVLLQLVTALGAALFLANSYALLRRRFDRRQAAKTSVARTRPGSPVRKEVLASPGRLSQAPVARITAYLLIGLLVMVWGIASMTS